MEKSAINIPEYKRTNFIKNLEMNFCVTFDSLAPTGLDASDFGNALGQFLKKECNESIIGFGLSDFLHGLRHGLMLDVNKLPYDKVIDSMVRNIDNILSDDRHDLDESTYYFK